jgi:hypothetical protein
MFTIDFMKGQGLPKKSRPVDAAVFAVAVAGCALVLCVVGVQYFCNAMELRSKEQTLANAEAKLKDGAGEKGSRVSADADIAVYKQGRGEIASSIGRYVQWTPVLRDLAETLRPAMLVNELSVLRTVKKVKVTSVKDAEKKVDYEIINRILKGDIYEFVSEDNDVEVKKYLASLRRCEWLENVYLAESGDAEYDGKSVKNHIINCMLSSQEVAGAK